MRVLRRTLCPGAFRVRWRVLRRTAASLITLLGGRACQSMSALNQIFADLLPTLNDQDIVLVQDADSILDPHFAEVAAKYLTHGYGGVGWVFRGGPGGGFMGHLQRKEYARYARDVSRLDGNVLYGSLDRTTWPRHHSHGAKRCNHTQWSLHPVSWKCRRRGREGSVRRLYSRRQRPICIYPERQH